MLKATKKNSGAIKAIAKSIIPLFLCNTVKKVS